MKIPTPDAYLIELANGIMAKAQRRGLVLPSILSALLVLALVGAAIELGVCIALARLDSGVLAGVVFLLLATTYVPLSVIYHRHGAAWGPDLTKAYFAKAVNERVSAHAKRLRHLELLAGAGFFTGTFAVLDLREWGTALLFLVPMLMTWLCSSAQSYAACALPAKPDAESRMPKVAPVLAA